MELYGISVWQDPDWQGGRYGTPRWLAGVNFSVETEPNWSTLTGGGGAMIDADFTASGNTVARAVFACVENILKGLEGAP